MLWYWFGVLQQAFWESLEIIGQQAGGIAFGILCLGVAAVFIWRSEGIAALKALPLRTALQACLVTIIAWLPFYTYSILKIPYEDVTKARAEVVTGLEKTKRVEIRTRLASFANNAQALINLCLTIDDPRFSCEDAYWLYRKDLDQFLRESLEPSYYTRFGTAQASSTLRYKGRTETITRFVNILASEKEALDVFYKEFL